MTTAHKSGFQWGVIVTLAISCLGLAVSYGAKAERIETMATAIKAQDARIAALEQATISIASDVRIMRHIIEEEHKEKTP